MIVDSDSSGHDDVVDWNPQTRRRRGMYGFAIFHLEKQNKRALMIPDDRRLPFVWISFENIPLPMCIDYTNRKRRRKKKEREEVEKAKEERA